MRSTGRYIQVTLLVADLLPDYPVEWEVLPPDLFDRLVTAWRGSRGRARHLIETKGRMHVLRHRRKEHQ
ncbi:hypothetical protein [Bifidobacterium platyrrhinorum]|uniref:Uncharacterized protein n=1 Tax=Bifidobacterium platyrrhinorum TaxID=2661628 RepID=A0A6L9SSB3_9BIFI|nr:hypothetical protein [Bifidobacterium platyrrhinorum]NEG55414.1 hypothetical protein [Bifidobacterium platyrrhinorum]